MNAFNILQDWKSKPYQKTNYDNIHAFYGDQKYIRMKPKTHITLTPGLLHLIIKYPKEWIQQNFKLDEEVTLHNETHNILYYTVIDSLISDEEKQVKLHVKNGIPKCDVE
jgi:hypothetical protein|tara:strand:- start:50 stop:379 length:330 start_codon:yes stop_codon:yes gene_type:complete